MGNYKPVGEPTPCGLMTLGLTSTILPEVFMPAYSAGHLSSEAFSLRPKPRSVFGIAKTGLRQKNTAFGLNQRPLLVADAPFEAPTPRWGPEKPSPLHGEAAGSTWIFPEVVPQ